MSDWEPARARRNGQDWRITRYERGDWPSARSVRRHFGRFSAAIEAAGFKPRPIGQRQLRPATEENHRASVESRRAASRTGFGAAELARCVKSVAAAQLAADTDALGDALLDVAATALRWADHLVITAPRTP